MVVLGLDPSTKFGVAVVDTSKTVLHSEEIEFKKQSGFERINSLVARVVELMEEYKPDLVVIEDMIVGHASSAVTVIQIASVLRFFLWQEGVKFLDVNPGTLKKFVAGSGNATKDQIMMHVFKRWGFESKTNNIADAVGLAMVGLGCIGVFFDSSTTKMIDKFLGGVPQEVGNHLLHLQENFAINCNFV